MVTFWIRSFTRLGGNLKVVKCIRLLQRATPLDRRCWVLAAGHVLPTDSRVQRPVRRAVVLWPKYGITRLTGKSARRAAAGVVPGPPCGAHKQQLLVIFVLPCDPVVLVSHFRPEYIFAAFFSAHPVVLARPVQG